jgi:hypothetical protein
MLEHTCWCIFILCDDWFWSKLEKISKPFENSIWKVVQIKEKPISFPSSLYSSFQPNWPSWPGSLSPSPHRPFSLSLAAGPLALLLGRQRPAHLSLPLLLCSTGSPAPRSVPLPPRARMAGCHPPPPVRIWNTLLLMAPAPIPQSRAPLPSSASTRAFLTRITSAASFLSTLATKIAPPRTSRRRRTLGEAAAGRHRRFVAPVLP